jgi:hypothetical protein
MHCERIQLAADKGVNAVNMQWIFVVIGGGGQQRNLTQIQQKHGV